MKIGDTVKILIEIEPHCSCSSFDRGDEIMTCAAHGLKGYRQSSIHKEIYGTIQKFYNETYFNPPTALISMDKIGSCQFNLYYGHDYLWESPRQSTYKIISLKLDDQYLLKPIYNKTSYKKWWQKLIDLVIE